MTRRTSKRKTSHRTKPVRRGTAARRTSRRVRSNTIPPPPDPWDRPDYSDHDGTFARPSPVRPMYLGWADKTFAPGTNVEFLSREEAWAKGPTAVRVRPGDRGVVSFFAADGFKVEVPSPHGPAYATIDPRSGDIHERLRPLDDNWGPLVVPARRTSRRVRPNTIPPPPQGNVSDLAKWALKTYQKGTRVRTRVAMDVWFPSEDRVASIPAGTVGKVADVDPSSGLFIVLGHVTVPLFTSSTTTRWMKNSTPEFIDTYFEPLDDNWGPLVVAPKRHSPPPTSGWQKQLSASRRMRARNVQPNGKSPKFSEMKLWMASGDVRASRPKAMSNMFPPGLKARLKRLPPGVYKWGVGPKRGEVLTRFTKASVKGAITSSRIGASKAESFHLVIDNFDPSFPVILRGIDDRGRTTFRIEEFAEAKVPAMALLKKASRKAGG